MFLNEKYYMPVLRKIVKILDHGRTEVHSLDGVKGEVRDKI